MCVPDSRGESTCPFSRGGGHVLHSPQGGVVMFSILHRVIFSKLCSPFEPSDRGHTHSVSALLLVYFLAARLNAEPPK